MIWKVDPKEKAELPVFSNASDALIVLSEDATSGVILETPTNDLPKQYRCILKKAFTFVRGSFLSLQDAQNAAKNSEKAVAFIHINILEFLGSCLNGKYCLRLYKKNGTRLEIMTPTEEWNMYMIAPFDKCRKFLLIYEETYFSLIFPVTGTSKKRIRIENSGSDITNFKNILNILRNNGLCQNLSRAGTQFKYWDFSSF